MATIKQPGPYTLATSEWPTEAEFQALGLKGRTDRRHVRAVATGEMRLPRKGEWFLSGAEVEAYKAHNDLTTKYHIARLVKVETVTRIVS